MQAFTFSNGHTLDKPLDDILSGALRYLVRAYKSSEIKESLKDADHYRSDLSDVDRHDYSWLSFIFKTAIGNKYCLERLNYPTPRLYSDYGNDQDLVYKYLLGTPPTSMQKIFTFVAAYVDLIKYDKGWREHYGSRGPLKPISEYLVDFLRHNINQAYSVPRDNAFSFFLPHCFVNGDMDVQTMLEMATQCGLTTRYHLANRYNYFDPRQDYWIFSCLIKPEITEQFIFEYLVLDRKPTHFRSFSTYGLLLTQYQGSFRASPYIQKASAAALMKRLKKFNTYHLEKLEALVCLIDDVNPFAIELMSLQVNSDGYERAKHIAEKLLVVHKLKVNYHLLGEHTEIEVLDAYKAYLKKQEDERAAVYKIAYDTMRQKAVAAIVNTFRTLNQLRLNELCFGLSEWTWTIDE